MPDAAGLDLAGPPGFGLAAVRCPAAGASVLGAQVGIADAAVHPARRDQIGRTKPFACGFCGSHLHILENRWHSRPGCVHRPEACATFMVGPFSRFLGFCSRHPERRLDVQVKAGQARSWAGPRLSSAVRDSRLGIGKRSVVSASNPVLDSTPSNHEFRENAVLAL